MENLLFEDVVILYRQSWIKPYKQSEENW